MRTTTVAHSATAPAPPRRNNDDAKQATRTTKALQLALATRGMLSVDGIVICCPMCGKGSPADPVASKFKMFDDGGFKHFSSAGCHGDAISVLTAGGISFADAVRYLNGQPTSVRIDKPERVPDIAVETFTATFDAEVYHGVCVYGRKSGGVDAAVEFYSQWHINADAVVNSAAVYITDPDTFAQLALKRFGAERLIACGLFVATDDGARCLISDNFPVVEPHRHPDGTELYLQFRASDAQYRRYLDHKAGKRAFKGSQKFLSLRGAARHTQIGCGLPAIAASPGTPVYLREGFKDQLADTTRGNLAYGIPGVDFRPGPLPCKLLAGRDVIVGLDGDAAGEKHQSVLVEYLRKHGVTARLADAVNGPASERMLPGHDVTDMLISGHASSGCTCPACATYRQRHRTGTN